MTPENSDKPTTAESRDAAFWAQPISKLKVSDVPSGALNLNMDGRHVASPLQGFGRMWVRTYRVRLNGIQVTPEEVVRDWKENFARFQPPENHFYPSLSGVKPGEIIFIDTKLPVLPGTPGILPVAVGVMVMYADDESFTVMTPEGHPVAGWNTFGAYDDKGTTVAQIQALIRASDPIYEFGYRFLGGEPQEDGVWKSVLTALARRWGVEPQVEMEKTCLDPKIQWAHWKNIWNNAMIRTTLYVMASPVRWVRKSARHSTT